MVAHLPQGTTCPDWPAQQLGSCATSVVSSVMWMNPTFVSLWATTILSLYSQPSWVKSFFMEAYSWQPLTADDMLGSFRWTFSFAVVRCSLAIYWCMSGPYRDLEQHFLLYTLCKERIYACQVFCQRSDAGWLIIIDYPWISIVQSLWLWLEKAAWLDTLTECLITFSSSSSSVETWPEGWARPWWKPLR